MKRHLPALVVTAFPVFVALAYACGSDDGASSAPAAEAGADGTSASVDGSGPLGDGGAPATACASFADAAAPYESLGTAVLHGANVDGSFCARIKVRSGSYNHTSPSDLVLELDGIRGSFTYANPPATVGGNLITYVGLGTSSAGTSVSTDPGECGDVYTGILLAPSPDDHHCEVDAGGPSECAYGCYRVCTGDAGCAGIACQPVPVEVGYEASLAGNCLGLITTPRGGWTVNLTSLEPTGRNPPYTAHGTLEGTLLERGDAGDAATPATLTITF